MQTEIHYKDKIKRILYMIGQGIFLITTIVLSKKISCPFKKIFHIPCPFCGLTRAFYSLKKLNIKEAIHYNILSIPLVIIILTINMIFIIEIITNKRILATKKITKEKVLVIIIILIISILWGWENRV